MPAPSNEPTVEISLFADDGAVPAAVAVMHRAFAQYSEKGQPSGALHEDALTLRKEMADGVRLGVARAGERIVGLVKHRPASDGTLYFGRLSVDPEARGHGIAGRIVRALRAQAEAEGLAGLSCAVRADETDNIAIYRHLGMDVVGQDAWPSLTGATIDVVLMRDRRGA